MTINKSPGQNFDMFALVWKLYVVLYKEVMRHENNIVYKEIL